MSKSKYQSPMEPWPTLHKFGKRITLYDEELSLFYFEAGDNHQSIILMIHGLGDEADTWRHVIHPLAEQFHVIAIDLPGFGRSDKPMTDYTPRFFLKTIEGFIKAMDINHVHFMGSSLGAILSQGFAINNPSIVQGLILVDGALLQHEPMFDWGFRMMQVPLLGEWLYTRLRKDPDAAFDSLRNVYHDLNGMTERDRDFLYQRVNQRVWSDGQRRAYFSTLRNLPGWVNKSQEGLIDQLSDLNIPTLVIRGEFDPLFPEENADKLTAAQADLAKVIIHQAGHLPHQEAPQAFFKTVLLWLEGQTNYE